MAFLLPAGAHMPRAGPSTPSQAWVKETELSDGGDPDLSCVSQRATAWALRVATCHNGCKCGNAAKPDAVLNVLQTSRLILTKTLGGDVLVPTQRISVWLLTSPKSGASQRQSRRLDLGLCGSRTKGTSCSVEGQGRLSMTCPTGDVAQAGSAVWVLVGPGVGWVGVWHAEDAWRISHGIVSSARCSVFKPHFL